MSYFIRILTIVVVFSASFVFAEAESEQEKNKDVARQWIKNVWQEHNSSFINEITTEDFDRAGAIAFADTVFAHHSVFTVEIVDLIAEDDKVAVAWKATGTNSEELTKGKELDFSGVSLLRFEGGKMAEIQGYWNQWTIFQQLGFTLTPPSAEPDKKEE